MQDHFNKMQDIVARRAQGKISSRIRFMLQDVIDLRANKWIPRRGDSTPKTIDEIQKEAESERLDSQLSNTPLNTPRKDERTSDRKRNRKYRVIIIFNISYNFYKIINCYFLNERQLTYLKA